MHRRHCSSPVHGFFCNNTMEDANTNTDKQWYAIRVTYNRELKVKADLDAQGIDNFIPMKYVSVMRGKERRVKKLVPAIHNLIFMLVDRATMVQYKATTTLPIRYIMNRETHQPVVIPRKQMDNFIAVAGNHSEQLLYIENDPIILHKGDKVRITGGLFEGAIGTLMRIKGNRRVVVSIPGVIAVATTDIHPSLIEKIE